MRDLKNFFTAEDFKAAMPIGMSEVGCIDAARIANAIFTEWLGKPVRVRGEIWEGRYGGAFYVDDGVKEDTHTALLVCVEKLEG